MSFRSTNRLPAILDFETAEKLFNSIKPIRGSVTNKNPYGLRPMAHRRDTNLHIGKKVDAQGNVVYELNCYQSPVIKVRRETIEEAGAGMGDGEGSGEGPHLKIRTLLTIRPHYVSQMTCSFLANILWTALPPRRPRFNVKGHRGGRSTIIMTLNDSKFVLASDTEITLTYEQEAGVLRVYSARPTPVIVPDRKKLAAATAPYKEFADYYDGFVALLTQDVPDEDDPDLADADPFTTKKRLAISRQSLADAFGTVVTEGPGPRKGTLRLDRGHVAHMFNKPTRFSPVKEGDFGFEFEDRLARQWDGAVQWGLSLMRSDQPEDVKTENFYKAALALVAGNYFTRSHDLYIHDRSSNLLNVYLSLTTAKGLLREFFLLAFAEDVMVVRSMPAGAKGSAANYGRYLLDKGKHLHAQAKMGECVGE